MDYKEAVKGKNLAADLKDDQLKTIGNNVVDGYLKDRHTRKTWEEDYKKYVEMALQVTEEKTFPWNKASNVKYPLLSTAAMQFNARAYPTLIPSDGRLVKCKTYGRDPTGEKAQAARRISTHQSYQILEQMDNWEEEMDKLLLVLPIVGVCFKKSYWDYEKEKPCSKLIMPDELVADYYTRSLEESERVTEILFKNKRKVKECQLAGYYLDVTLGEPQQKQNPNDATVYRSDVPASDETTPYTILEQHTFLDLDKDGYTEPYVVTVEEDSRQVLRIAARFEMDGIKTDEEGKIIAIKPTQYYTKYGFIPNPDGSFYDIGFGKLLGPLGHSIDTLINQLVDSGTLNNLQAGFIGKGLRIRMGETKFSPGEWKGVNATGDDIKKQIFPLPTKDPSPVLFQLLGLLIQSVKELASVAEIMTGKMPGQNTPAYTTQETVKQGMALFTAIYKRVYRSLTQEFRKIFIINRTYIDKEEYISILDEPVKDTDYKTVNENDVVPAADPSASSQTEKMARAQELASLLQLGTLDPMAVTMRILTAMEEENPQELFRQEPPPPDPKVQAAQMKAQSDQAKVQLEMEKSKVELMLDQQRQQFEMAMEQQRNEMDMKFQALKLSLELQGDQAKLQQQLQSTAATNEMNMATQAQQHNQNMVVSAQQHEQKMQQQMESQKAKPKSKKE